MTLKRIGIIALIIAILFWNPYTRRIVLFLLPLGKGIDDIIMIIAMIVAVLIFGGRWSRELTEDVRKHLDKMSYNSRTRVIFFVILGLALVVIAVVAWITISTIQVSQWR